MAVVCNNSNIHDLGIFTTPKASPENTAPPVESKADKPKSSVAFFAKPQFITQNMSDLAEALDLATYRATVQSEADLLDAINRTNPKSGSSPKVVSLRYTSRSLSP